ncbi:MAG: L,D-transpeptidase family protein [Pseudobdellovibrionaceae bacterium]
MISRICTWIISCALVIPFWGSFSSLALAAEETSTSQTKTNSELLPSDLLQISNTDAFSKYVFLVDKTERHLQVFERKGETIEKIIDVPSDMGKNVGNKSKRDDARTPEGIYFFEKKLNQPEIPFGLYGELAFTTDYPNIFDRRESKTGSGIWLHAVPDTVPLTRGSRGCVVVRNEVIKKLQDYIKLKETPILIFDKVSYVPKEEHEKRRSALNDFIEGWRKAWQSQNIDEYMTYYDQNFKAPGFNYSSWKAHKNRLKNQYEFIKVQLSQPFLLLHKDQLIVKTFQRYESNNHTDFGVKTLYAVKTESGYKIIREEWVPANENLTTSTATAFSAPQPTAPTN